MSRYEVQTPVFEGPFDLLLHLITREQVDLYEVSLAGIVDAYLAELERMGRLDLDVATEFLLIAATLVELKTRRLLPGRDDVDLDEELALWEERDLLLARLLECKTFKDAAAALVRAHGRGRALAAPRTAGLEERFLGADARPARGRHARRPARPRFLRAVDAQAAAAGRPRPRGADPRQRADAVERAGRRAAAASARSPSGASPAHLVERLEVIVRFLAVLELYKQGLVELDQADDLRRARRSMWLGGDDADAGRRDRRRRVRWTTYDG